MRLESIFGPSGNAGRRVAVATALSALGLAVGGCLEKGFLDQTELGAFNKEAMVVPIVDKLSPAIEEPMDMFVNAREPTAEDLVPSDTDYGLSPGDLIAVSITDLIGPGVESLKQVRVTDTGRISLPYINQIQIAGLTEAQAEQAISNAYRDAQIIQNAQVSVVTIEPRGRTYTIAGAVGRAGQYPIFKNDLRLIEAFAIASDFDVTRGTRGYEVLYIIRKVKDGEAGSGAATPTAPADTTPADVLRPRSQANPWGDDLRRATYLRVQPSDPATPTETPVDSPATTPAAEPTGEGRYVIIDGKPVLVGGAPAATDPAAAPVDAVGAPAEPPAMTLTPVVQPVDVAAFAPPGEPFEFNAPQEPTDQKIIRIPIDKLVRGELKYNVVVRPGDTIFVPSPIEGVYYMGGHVARQGVYGLQGNKVSLMDAIIAAGGLDQLAVPWRTQVIRRVGDNQIFATVDLTKIFNGEEPDLYLKKDDKVIVGTQAWAPFLAALRNGFRITYGFGFLYDRNYYDDDDN